jgi:hypothetical protein
MFSQSGSSSTAEQQPPRPSWQVNAPKAELFVPKKTAQEQEPGNSSEEPAYPPKFAELIQCIQEGRPVPGVREIPNSLVRDPVGQAPQSPLLHLPYVVLTHSEF